MIAESIPGWYPAVLLPPRLAGDERLADERLGAIRPAQRQRHRAETRRKGQLDAKKSAAAALGVNKLEQLCMPLPIPGKAPAVAVRKLIDLLCEGEELASHLLAALGQVLLAQRAGNNGADFRSDIRVGHDVLLSVQRSPSCSRRPRLSSSPQVSTMRPS